MDLYGKIVLVTGGTSGIGKAIAEAFVDEGCRVALCGTRTKAVEEIELAGRARAKTCDISDRSQVRSLFNWVENELGSIDILVNSAAINFPKRDMANLDPEEFDRLLAVNLTGTFNCIHAALPGMRQKESGLIINIVSLAGRRVSRLAGAPYTASKFAMGALGTYVNKEDAENGIRVSNIYPGETNTPIIDRRDSPPSADRRKEMLQPEDLAECALMIAKLPSRAVVTDLVIAPPYMMRDYLD